ncbi:NAD dependent epimerase/dehydratase family [Coleofasciculus chthonoplastes PCC 7420]|uniref:NAD dependent epimerase/dehydratase family n=1 Tax=Coleofasciculus chthonoplastes PCC 7420 TaxID=118168 RepID=B4VZZ8_9CYAN|nr:NAD-dependent epimerase/dehydratase family protein [Coleofasciculus chthonoplastes]EDX72470.1 NAD dependent epimerase/dehydratase family [Coleofasciculus chthonoplastes PCC 7420]
MNSILITGATGFVGSKLIMLLSRKDWDICLAIRKSLPQLTFDTFDVTPVLIKNIDSCTDWQQSLNGIDSVIHLAARVHIWHEDTLDSEAEFLKVNFEGTANLVKQSIQAGVKHFMFISSIGAMATLSDHPLTETSPCQPDTPYGRSKLQAEQALIELASQSSMTWTILRPTLVYGSGNPGNMERLIKLINRGLPLPFGLVNNRRSLLYVGNLVDAIATCLTHPNAKNQTFLVSDGQDLSTPELIGKIAYHLERPCHLLPVPPSLLKLAGHLGDTIEQFTQRPLPLNTSTIDRLLGSLVVDSSHIRNTLNWQPPYTVDEGLSKTLR